jgi:hypothetical protein
MAGAMEGVVEQQVLGQLAQAHACAVLAAVSARSSRPALSSCWSMRCIVGFGHAGFFNQALQREELVLDATTSSSANRRSVGVSPLISVGSWVVLERFSWV